MINKTIAANRANKMSANKLSISRNIVSNDNNMSYEDKVTLLEIIEARLNEIVQKNISRELAMIEHSDFSDVA